MRKMLLICVFAIVSLSASSQTTTSELFGGREITGISVGGGCDVTLRQGSNTNVTVTVSDRVKDDFKFELINGIFSVRMLKTNIRGDYWKNITLKLDIVCTSLDVANISGGADLEMLGDFTTSNLTMNVSGGADVISDGVLTCISAVINASGGADIKLNIKASANCSMNVSGGADAIGSVTANKLNVNISGGADCKLGLLTNSTNVAASGGATIKLSGKSDKADFRASGAGDVFAQELVVQDVIVLASGGSDVKVHAVNTLSVSKSGGADVAYMGTPTINMRNKDLIKL